MASLGYVYNYSQHRSTWLRMPSLGLSARVKMAVLVSMMSLIFRESERYYIIVTSVTTNRVLSKQDRVRPNKPFIGGISTQCLSIATSRNSVATNVLISL